MRKEIILSGFGGQGLILAGVLMAEAAVIFEKIYATQNQVYGIEARGGECCSEVILNETEEIHYAEISAPDVVLAMSQEAFNKFAPRVKPGGLVVIDSVFVENTDRLAGHDCIIKSFPITALCKEATGKTMLANVTALGILCQLTGFITNQNMAEEILCRVPRGTEALNKTAFECGVAVALKA